MARTSSLLRSGSSLSVLTLVSRCLGLVREMVKAALLGTGPLSDAFSVAFMLPNLFRRLFAEGSVAVAFIPTFKEFLISNNENETRDFLRSFWTFLSFLVSIVVALGILTAPLIMPVFGLEASEEGVFLTRIMFPYLLFISIAAFFQGILNSVHSFVPSALGPILLNVSIISFSWFLTPLFENPARAMACGVFTGGLLEALVQLPFVIRRRFYFSWVSLRHALKNPGTKKVLRLVLPTIVGMAAYQLNDVVSTALAGNAGEGVVSGLQYSLRLQELILGVFAVSIGTVLLPRLAEDAKTGNWNAYNARLSDSISIIALITIPAVVFSLSQGESLIRLLFQTRAFDERSVMLTKEAFMFHICGLFFIALNRILAPAFYAQSDSVSPTVAGLISFAVNMALAYVLAGKMAGGGIALALSVSGAINTIFLFIFLRKNKMITLKNIMSRSYAYILKICVFSCIAIIPIHLFAKQTYGVISRLKLSGRFYCGVLPFIIHTVLFTTIGIMLLVFTKDRYADMLFRTIKKRYVKNRTNIRDNK